MSQSRPHQRTYFSPRAGLCALRAKLQADGFFEPIERQVRIRQKAIAHQPCDKLRDVFIGALSGIRRHYLTDKVVHADMALQSAFGRTECAQQAIIQHTLLTCEPENVTQLRAVSQELFRRYNRACRHDLNQQHPGGTWLLDLGLSGERTSKHAQQAANGYFAGHRNAYGRQLGRILVAPYNKIVVDHLYPGNTSLSSVMAAVVQEAEIALNLRAEQRSLLARIVSGPTGWRRAAIGLSVVVVSLTVLWALAAFSIYTRPNTRVAASRWIYDYVRTGSVVANEHWDCRLPLPVDGHNPFAGMYTGLEMQNYDEDTPEKLEQMLGWLDQADYIFLASNRL